MKTLYKKLFEVQKEIKAIVKDESNPAFKGAKYFDINTLIAEVKPTLLKHGLLLLQPVEHLEGKRTISTIVVETETGEEMKTTTYLPDVTDAQKFGAAITYFRRYALTSLLLLEAEDDDGNSGKTETPKSASQAPAAQNVAPGSWQSFIMPFGKHKGKALGDLDAFEHEYLEWLSGQEIKNPGLAQAMSARKANQTPMTNADLVPADAPVEQINLEDIPF